MLLALGLLGLLLHGGGDCSGSLLRLVVLLVFVHQAVDHLRAGESAEAHHGVDVVQGLGGEALFDDRRRVALE